MKWFILVMIFSLTFSCNYKENLDLEKKSREIAKNEYDFVYKSATDSVKLWSSLDLESYDEDKNGFVLDKIICFNSQVNKCVMSISQQNFEDESDTFITNTDYMQFFYGAKIKDTWYFFKGANIVLPREMYQKDVTKPLSFEKLHEIALKEVFRGYLKPKERRFWEFYKPTEYEVNEAWFDRHFKEGYLNYDYRNSPNYQYMAHDSTEPIFTNQEDYLEYCYKRSALGVWNSKK